MERPVGSGSATLRPGPADEFGERVVVCEPGQSCIETLTVTDELSREPAFGEAVVRRARLLDDRPIRGLARVTGVELPLGGARLRVRSEWSAGERLSDLVARRSRERRPLTPGHVMFVARQAVSSLRALHGLAAGACHGALMPAHLVLTEDRLVIGQAALGAGLCALGWPGDHVRQRLGLPVPALAGIPAFTPLTDQFQLGWLMLGMLTGELGEPFRRPLTDLGERLADVRERDPDGTERPLNRDLRHLLERMLLLSPEGPFRSFAAIERALDALVASHPACHPVPPAVVVEAAPSDGGVPPASNRHAAGPAPAYVAARAVAEEVTSRHVAPPPPTQADALPVGPGQAALVGGTTGAVTAAVRESQLPEAAASGVMPPIPAWWRPTEPSADNVAAQPARDMVRPGAGTPSLDAPGTSREMPSMMPQVAPGAGDRAPAASPEPQAFVKTVVETSGAGVTPSAMASVASSSSFPGDPFLPSQRHQIPAREALAEFGWNLEDGSTRDAADDALGPAQGTTGDALGGRREHRGRRLLARWRLVAAVLGVVATAGVAGGWWLGREGGPWRPAPLGHLRVESKPAGASVFVNGELKATTPATVALAPGSYRVDFELGSETRSLTVPVAADQEAYQIVSLYPPGPPGQLIVGSVPPGATVALNGEVQGRTPLTLDAVAPGEHALTVESGAVRIQRTVEVMAGAVVEVMLPISGSVEVQSPFEVSVFDRQRPLGTTRGGRVTVPAGRRRLTFVNESLNFEETRDVEITAGSVSRVVLTPPTGTINFSADVACEVFLDGRPLGPTPLTNVPVSLGAHEVLFRHPRWGEVRYSIFVTVGPANRLHATLLGSQRGVSRTGGGPRRR